MRDRCRRPIVTLNVPLIRKEEGVSTLKMSVTFEATLDLTSLSVFHSEEELYQYLSAHLLEHVYKSYWYLRGDYYE